MSDLVIWDTLTPSHKRFTSANIIVVISFFAMKSLTFFLYAMTAPLLCDEQYFVSMTLSNPRWEHNEMCTEFVLEENKDSQTKRKMFLNIGKYTQCARPSINLGIENGNVVETMIRIIQHALLVTATSNDRHGIFNYLLIQHLFNILFKLTKKRNTGGRRHCSFVGGIPRWPVDSPHKGVRNAQIFLFDKVIMFHMWLAFLSRFPMLTFTFVFPWCW